MKAREKESEIETRSKSERIGNVYFQDCLLLVFTCACCLYHEVR